MNGIGVQFQHKKNSIKNHAKTGELGPDYLVQRSNRHLPWRGGALWIGYNVFKFMKNLRRVTDQYKYESMKEEEFELIGDKSSVYVRFSNSSLKKNRSIDIEVFLRWTKILASTITAISLIVLPFFYFHQDVLRIITIIMGSSYGIEIFAFIQNKNYQKVWINLILIFAIAVSQILGYVTVILVVLKLSDDWFQKILLTSQLGENCVIISFSKFISLALLNSHLQTTFWIFCDHYWTESIFSITASYLDGFVLTLQNFFFLSSHPPPLQSCSKLALIVFYFINIGVWLIFVREQGRILLHEQNTIKSASKSNFLIGYLNKRTHCDVKQQFVQLPNYLKQYTEQKSSQKFYKTLELMPKQQNKEFYSKLYGNALKSCKRIWPLVNSRIIQEIVLLFKEEFYPPNKLILDPSSTDRHFIFVQEGKLKLYLNPNIPHRNVVKKGESVGEDELISNQRSDKCVETEEFTTTIQIGFTELIQVLKKDPVVNERFQQIRDCYKQKKWQFPMKERAIESQMCSIDHERKYLFRKRPMIKYDEATVKEAALILMVTQGLVLMNQVTRRFMDRIGLRQATLAKMKSSSFIQEVSKSNQFVMSGMQVRGPSNSLSEQFNLANHSNISAINHGTQNRLYDDQSLDIDGHDNVQEGMQQQGIYISQLSAQSYLGVNVIPEVEEEEFEEASERIQGTISHREMISQPFDSSLTDTSKDLRFKSWSSSVQQIDKGSIEIDALRNYRYYFPGWNVDDVIQKVELRRYSNLSGRPHRSQKSMKSLGYPYLQNHRFQSNLSFVIGKLGKSQAYDQIESDDSILELKSPGYPQSP